MIFFGLCFGSQRVGGGIAKVQPWVYKTAIAGVVITDSDGGEMKLKESEDEEELEEESEESEEADEPETEEAPAADTDNVGDASVEINVEELIHEIEVQGGDRPGREQAAKRRLEDLMERKRSKRELEDFEDYEI